MTKTSLLLAAFVATQIGFAATAGAQSLQLLAGNMTDDVGALPSRARKSSAPEITVPLKLEALRVEGRPALKNTLLVGEEVLRLVGAGFGRDASGREIQLTFSGNTTNLTVLSWRDDEIRVQLPSLDDLGIDAATAMGYVEQLNKGKKAVLGPSVEIGIMLEGQWVAKRIAQLAVAYRDLDGDGSLTADDCDDFDPRKKPGNKEVFDPEGVDEDCNPSTQALPPAAPAAAAPAVPVPQAAPAQKADALESLDL